MAAALPFRAACDRRAQSAKSRKPGPVRLAWVEPGYDGPVWFLIVYTGPLVGGNFGRRNSARIQRQQFARKHAGRSPPSQLSGGVPGGDENAQGTAR